MTQLSGNMMCMVKGRSVLPVLHVVQAHSTPPVWFSINTENQFGWFLCVSGYAHVTSYQYLVWALQPTDHQLILWTPSRIDPFTVQYLLVSVSGSDMERYSETQQGYCSHLMNYTSLASSLDAWRGDRQLNINGLPPEFSLFESRRG